MIRGVLHVERELAMPANVLVQLVEILAAHMWSLRMLLLESAALHHAYVHLSPLEACKTASLRTAARTRTYPITSVVFTMHMHNAARNMHQHSSSLQTDKKACVQQMPQA